MAKKKGNLLVKGGALCAAVVAAGAIGLTMIPKYSYLSTRVLFGISDSIRDFGLKVPEDVERITDLAFGQDPMQMLDIYYPKGTREALPVIVNFHGGGYTYGDKDLYQYYCMSLAKHGFAVVNFSYRLAPEHTFPAQIQDANSAISYAFTHAGEYMLDLENVFFVGDSAGAHLAAMYSAVKTNPEYQALLSLEIPEFTLRAAAFNCGVYTIAGRKDSMAYFVDGKPEDYAEELDICGHVTENFPPSFVMSATGDMALPHAEPFAKVLRDQGVYEEVHIYGDDKKKLPHVFHCNMKSEDAKICNDEECAFFMAYVEKEIFLPSKTVNEITISAQKAKTMMDSQEGYLILDVREQEEYDEVHIPRAVLLPLGQLEERAEEVLSDKNQLIFVYCRSGRRSSSAAEILLAKGYENLYNFGGILDWPYETETVSAEKSDSEDTCLHEWMEDCTSRTCSKCGKYERITP